MRPMDKPSKPARDKETTTPVLAVCARLPAAGRDEIVSSSGGICDGEGMGIQVARRESTNARRRQKRILEDGIEARIFEVWISCL